MTIMTPSATHQGRCDECQEWTTVNWFVFETSSSTLCDSCVQAEVSEDPFSSLIVREAVAPKTGCNGGCTAYCRCWN